MKTISIAEFRRHAKTYLDAVEEGERVRILRHGKPIADVVPCEDNQALPRWKRPGLRLNIKGVSLSEEILRARRESKR